MLDKYIQIFTRDLKTRNFKKNRLTWYKQCNDDITIVFSIQKSQYGLDVWYYNFGIGLRKMNASIKSISNCQILYRVDSKINNCTLKPEQVIQIVELWESKYGNLRDLRIQALEGKLKSFWISQEAMVYLTQVDITKI